MLLPVHAQPDLDTQEPTHLPGRQSAFESIPFAFAGPTELTWARTVAKQIPFEWEIEAAKADQVSRGPAWDANGPSGPAFAQTCHVTMSVRL